VPERAHRRGTLCADVLRPAGQHYLPGRRHRRRCRRLFAAVGGNDCWWDTDETLLRGDGQKKAIVLKESKLNAGSYSKVDWKIKWMRILPWECAFIIVRTFERGPVSSPACAGCRLPCGYPATAGRYRGLGPGRRPTRHWHAACARRPPMRAGRWPRKQRRPLAVTRQDARPEAPSRGL
jgi:hypothetical protein